MAGCSTDSVVICEYLDGLGGAPRLFPAAGPARIESLRRHALGNGAMDFLLLWRGELGRAAPGPAHPRRFRGQAGRGAGGARGRGGRRSPPAPSTSAGWRSAAPSPTSTSAGRRPAGARRIRRWRPGMPASPPGPRCARPSTWTPEPAAASPARWPAAGAGARLGPTGRTRDGGRCTMRPLRIGDVTHHQHHRARRPLAAAGGDVPGL